MELSDTIQATLSTGTYMNSTTLFSNVSSIGVSDTLRLTSAVNEKGFGNNNNFTILYNNNNMTTGATTLDILSSTAALTFENDTCGNDTTRSDFIDNEALQAVFCVLYSSIFILGVFGNALVCYVVLRNRAMQTVTNLFITNLALSDILLCVLAVPFTPLYTFMGKWIFGAPLCHLVPYAQGCSVYISTLTLTSIAIDRFFVIIYPFAPRMKLSTALVIIISVWLISLLVTSPYGLFMKIVQYNDTKYCEEHWDSEEIRKVFSLVTSTLQFGLPFVIMAFCYICVSIKLNDRTRARPGNVTSKREEQDRDRKKRTNRMLIAMVAIFGISWMPLNVVNILNDFESKINCWRYYNVLFFIAHLFAMSSTIYNPFVYGYMNDNFKKEFKVVLSCFFVSRSQSHNGSGNRQWRSERTCNGNNDTVQESLLPSSCLKPCMEIKPRDPIKEAGMRASIKSSAKSSDTIYLSDIQPPPPVQSQETIVLPDGVLETQFETTEQKPPLNDDKSNKHITANLIIGNGGTVLPLAPTKLNDSDTIKISMDHIF